MSELPKGWRGTLLNGVVDKIVGGGTPSKSVPSYYEGDIPWMTVKDMNKSYLTDTIDHITQEAIDNSSTNVIPAGTPIIATRMSLGKIVRASFDSAINQDLKALFVNREVDNYYFEYWYRSQGLKIESLGTGTTVKGVRLEVINALEFPLAPLAEQKRIVEKLDEVLAQVDTIKAHLDGIPALLKRFRQSVLASAVSGKLTEEWRRENSDYSTASMLDSFQELPKPARYNSRSTSFIQGVCATAVGKPVHKVVESWDWVPLVSIAKMESGHTPSRSKPEYWGGSVKWIGIKDARKNHANTISETEQRTNELGLANSASRLLPKDTICISRTASVGYVVKMGEPMATSQDFVNWVPSEVVYPDWLKWLFVAEKESLFKFGRGSTHTTVYFPEWLALHISLPPLQEQKEIVRLVDQYFAFADTIEAQVKKAQARVDNLTQSILVKAFRGELVPQDPNDEPADKLLERIAQARKEAEALAKAAKKAEAAKKKAEKAAAKG
ncbi:restriction endonuclease subunit S [Vibrio tubiashii]|uniref:restriction endonuclease subunit S n=1 Tax=Vibrio tubiashii TaxID=29498 RepID=UPI001EFE3C59|nr:restriction endonuclease subunit S [Vibrio tubiashii]MCG9578490.1 restriction endonuclease subunit S [Vibrio tubiashii]